LCEGKNNQKNERAVLKSIISDYFYWGDEILGELEVVMELK
jgi:hypothetical protein